MSAPMIRCARCQDTGGVLFADDGPGGPQPGPCPDCRGTPGDDDEFDGDDDDFDAARSAIDAHQRATATTEGE